MNNNFVGYLLMLVGFMMIFAVIASSIFESNELETIQNELETIQKEAIKYNYAKYDENNEFQWIIPEEAKEKGKKIVLRTDWEMIKNGVMFNILLSKFTRNKKVFNKLLSTGNAELIEGNTWHEMLQESRSK